MRQWIRRLWSGSSGVREPPRGVIGWGTSGLLPRGGSHPTDHGLARVAPRFRDGHEPAGSAGVRRMDLQPAVLELVVSDMAASLAFYRRLGLDVPTDADAEPPVEVPLGGLRLAFDTEETIRSFDPRLPGIRSFDPRLPADET